MCAVPLPKPLAIPPYLLMQNLPLKQIAPTNSAHVHDNIYIQL